MSHQPLVTKGDVRHHLLDFAIDEGSTEEGIVLLNHLVNDHWVGGPKKNLPDEIKDLTAEHAKLHALDILTYDPLALLQAAVPEPHQRCSSEITTWDERTIRCEKPEGHPKKHGFRIKWEDADV